MDEQPVTVLDEDASWQILARHEFGRLAYHLDGGVQIAPINYAVDGHRIVFFTAAGTKLAAVRDDDDVALEVDEVRDEIATSVIVRGRAYELPEDEARWVDQLRLRPWIRTVKDHVVAIEPSKVSGRQFALERPWLTMTPQRPD